MNLFAKRSVYQAIKFSETERFGISFDFGTDGLKTNHRIVFDDDFVPRISQVDDRLRPILVNNPQIAQQIIQSIQKISDGEELLFPLRLTNWKEELVPEKIAA